MWWSCRSADEGRTWTQAQLDIEVDVHEVHHDSEGSGALMIAAARGFASSHDGGHGVSTMKVYTHIIYVQ
ncbi:MAG: hypothetical protein CM1200mP9_04700 [Gammaproteobacteria bacterium]|nr:MAG: hypothetical protein CM1200mP9_04700 [Gammaproteobacteria bacterium]